MKNFPQIEKWIPNSPKIEIELVYADAKHPNNIFVNADYQAPYISDADFIVSDPIARILQYCADFLPPNMKMRLYDCLRPIEAQSFMKTFKDQLNIDHDMLSDPGAGGHPRAMAIDCAIMPENAAYGACPTDYGTCFDDLNFTSLEDGTQLAYAHRNNLHSNGFMAKQNRLQLEIVMQKAALKARVPLMPLPQEWWDFRLPKNKDDYGHILASFNRILLGVYESSPQIKTYGEFHDYWLKHYEAHLIPIEKRHIFEGGIQVPAEEDFIFYDDYAPISQADLDQMKLKVVEL